MRNGKLRGLLITVMLTVFSALPVRIGRISMTPFQPVMFTGVFWKLPEMPMP